MLLLGLPVPNENYEEYKKRLSKLFIAYTVISIAHNIAKKTI